MPTFNKMIANETNENFDYEDVVVCKELIEEKLPEYIVFPEELNKFLRNRIRDLTAENGALRRGLEQAEEKLRRMENNGGSMPRIPGTYGKSSEAAAVKIIALSRKCRERTAEVEVLKTKCKNLESSLASTKAQLEDVTSQGEKSKSSQTQESVVEKGTDEEESCAKDEEEKVKTLSEKLQQTQAKLYETKNTCSYLKLEINKAQKLLCSEVGENVTIAGLSSQPSGWRGRAEQIQMLQQKVAELQAKVSDHEGSRKESSVSLSRKCYADLRNAEKERRLQMENSTKELLQAKVALETSKRKLDASKARIKVLENEVNTLRGSIAVLNEKKSHDDQLIETLNSRLKAADIRYQERETEIKYREEKIDRDCTILRDDLQAANLQIGRLQKKLDFQEIEIAKLRNDAASVDSTKSRATSVTADENDQCTSSANDLKMSGPPEEYITLALAAEAERKRLLELVTVLNGRLDREKHEIDTLSESLRNEKSKCAKLETKLRKLETERVGLAKVDSGYKTKCFSKFPRMNENHMDEEQIRFKLELLQEECLVLKSRLDKVQQDKAADLATYKRMLDQARKYFQDACRNKSAVTGGAHSTITI